MFKKAPDIVSRIKNVSPVHKEQSGSPSGKVPGAFESVRDYDSNISPSQSAKVYAEAFQFFGTAVNNPQDGAIE